MIHYYRFHPKLKMFDPASCELRVGDVVCHKNRRRNVRSVDPLRLEYATGGSFRVHNRREVAVLPEYTRHHPQRVGMAPPAGSRAPQVDTADLCDQVGLALGQMLQHSAHGPVDIDRFFEDTTRSVLLRSLLGIQQPFELRHWNSILRECHATGDDLRARCFRALLLGRCLEHHRRPAGGGTSAAEQRGFGAFMALLEPVQPVSSSLASTADRSIGRPDTLRGVFLTMLHMAAPPPHLRVRPDRRVEVRDPGLCALYLDRLMHRLRAPPGSGAGPEHEPH